MEKIEVLAGLLVAVVMLVLLARRIAIPYPIVLVLGGLALGFVPGLPRVAMPPDLVLIVFLPPLLFAQAVTFSWRDFVANLRSILLLAVALVLATTGLVAVIAHGVIPSLPWAAAFALGAIVAPTDAVAASAIAQRLRIPRRIITILTGESLVNDGASLVAYKLAVAAAMTGAFSASHAAGQFILSSLGGIALGLAVGWGIGWVRHRMQPEPTVENTISLLSPFAAYLPAESLGVSGVLAVVAAGLYLGRQAPRFVTAPTRLQAVAIWGMIDFLLNGLLFILVGLQMRPILENVAAHHLPRLLVEAALLSLTVVAARIACVFFASYLTDLFSQQKAKRNAARPWQEVAVVAWTGMRGGISLAAALALPLTISGNVPFPERDLLIFLTFSVILSTLVIQGLSLPWLIRRLGLSDDGGAAQEEAQARQQATQAALGRLNEIAEAEDLPVDLVEDLRGHFAHMEARFAARVEGTGDAERESWAAALHRLRGEMITAERQTVVSLRDDGTISDTVLQRVQRSLDLEEQRLGMEEDGQE
ncbi:MAG: Na+/H+ antiporter [Janthinobacterium lividum]